MDVQKKIGARIKVIRNSIGLTQEKLAEKCELNSKYLSRIERGLENPTLKTLINISEKLDVNLDDIFSQLEIEDPDPEKRKSLIISLLDQADPEQLKLAYRILSVIIR